MRGVMLTVLIMLFVVFVAIPVVGQVGEAWVARYNGPDTNSNYDRAWVIAVDNSGNVYVTGSSGEIWTRTDYATIKYYPNGDTVWVRRYSGPGNGLEEDDPSAIAVDDFGNVYVTGASYASATAYDCATIKYYPNGDTAWVRRYDGPDNDVDGAGAMAVDNSGNVYVTGFSYSSATSGDYLTIKYHPNGDTAWVRTYNAPLNQQDRAYAIAVDDSGYVYVTGSSWVYVSEGYDYVTIKYYPNGDTAWVRRYNGTVNAHDEACAIAIDNSRNVYVTGSSQQILYYPYNFDYTTIKYYPNGDTAWVRRYNGPGDSNDETKAIAVDGSGNVYVTGWSYGGGTSEDYATIKYYPNGDTAWVRRYNGPGDSTDWANAIAVDGSGNVYVTGWSYGGGTSADYTTIKYDFQGNELWVRRYNGPGNDPDAGYAIAVDGSGNVYVTGGSAQTHGYPFNNYDFATIKYVQGPQPLIIRAFSPVDLIVTDPNNDNIGVGFNTIPGATYTAANDSIYIFPALIGDYKIRVIKDLLDTSGDTSYTIEARIDGTADQVLASDQPVPDSGESHNYVFTSDEEKLYCLSKPGDANADGNFTLSDPIATANYIFNKSGCTPKPDCWFKGLLCRGDWDGSTTVTLSDAIRGANYIFNKPGGPWNAIAVEPCCLP